MRQSVRHFIDLYQGDSRRTVNAGHLGGVETGVQVYENSRVQATSVEFECPDIRGSNNDLTDIRRVTPIVVRRKGGESVENFEIGVR